MRKALGALPAACSNDDAWRANDLERTMGSNAADVRMRRVIRMLSAKNLAGRVVGHSVESICLVLFLAAGCGTNEGGDGSPQGACGDGTCNATETCETCPLDCEACPPSCPFLAPVTTQTLDVPDSIDATGASDASAALQTWLNSVPDGSTIVFKAGGTYRMDLGLIANGRSNLILDGNGATLQSNGGFLEASSLLRIFNDTDILIRNFTLIGNSPTPGVFQGGQEGAHGVQIVGGARIEVAGCDISNTYGDCANTDYWSDSVCMHDCTCHYSGRCGFAVLSGTNLLIEHNTYDHNGGMVFDIEPYEEDGGADGVQFINNTSLYQAPYGPEDYFFGANVNGLTQSAGINNVTVSGNTLDHGVLKGIVAVSPVRFNSVVVTDNTAVGDTAAGPLLRFAHIDGLTVTGNQVALSSGELAQITDCTGVTYQP